MNYVFRKKYYRWIASALDAAGRVLFRRREQAVPEPKTILVVRMDHIGDVLAATGIPQALKGHHPSAHVIFLTSTVGKALLENNPYVDEVLVYDPPWFRRIGTPRTHSGFWRIVRALKASRIDLALSLRGDARENLLLFLAGIRFRIGYGITGLGFLLHRELTYREDAPEGQHSLDILRALGIRRDVLLPSLYFSEKEESRIAGLAAEKAGRKVVGIQFDAGSSAKTWPEANRAEFLEGLLQKFPEAVLWFLGADPTLAAWLEKKLDGASAANLVGKTTVRELLVRLKCCDLFIGPDSGPTHLAAALGVATLFLYSGTNLFDKWRPLEENADFLRNAVPCSPCYLTKCVVEGHPCMAGIQPERALRWLQERLHAA